METILYFIRHAQSHPTSKNHYSEWPLSSLGKLQAKKLADLLEPLEIERIYSSPFKRCLQTVCPFAKKAEIDIVVEDDLREQLIAETIMKGFYDIWCKSWQNFDFALSGCETSRHAQQRFVNVVNRILEAETGKTLAISAHGKVISLFLNSLESSVGKVEAEGLVNPDVVRIQLDDSGFSWDRAFSLHGLREIATDHKETPIETR